MTPEEAFILLIKKLIPNAITVTVGVVESVDKEMRTCDVIRDGQPSLFNCRLNAIVDTLESHVTSYPAVGSYVLCITLGEPTNCYVLATSQVDEVEIKVGKSSLVIDKEDITINGGTLGGLMKIGEFTSKINEFIGTFNTHTHGVAGNSTSVPVDQQTKFNRGDYENKNVKQ